MNDCKAADLDEDALEALLLDAGWLVEEIEMEPTVTEALPQCGVDVRGYPIVSVAKLGSAIHYTTVLIARKGREAIGCTYDRVDPAPVRAAAVLALALAAGVVEMED